MSKIMDGKLVAKNIKLDIKNKIKALNEDNIEVTLAVVLVGDDEASKIYVRNKKIACEFVGIKSKEYILKNDTTQEKLIKLIRELNEDKDIDGILVQLPLPKHINEKAIIGEINSKKDVDAFSDTNVGKIMIGDYDLCPCTPAGIMEILNYYNIDVCGKECVIVGRSNIVGKPMAMLMLHSNATVTICHSKTKNLEDICKRADILVSAVGKPNFIKANMIKDGAVVIDVGMNRDSNKKLCGDVDYKDVIDKVSYITPVPGGVGPTTIAMLMKNTYTAAEYKRKYYLSKEL